VHACPDTLGSLFALESFGDQLRVLNLKDTWVDVVGKRDSLGGLRGLLRLEQLSLGSPLCPVGFGQPRGGIGPASSSSPLTASHHQQPQQGSALYTSQHSGAMADAASLSDADVYDDAFFDAWVSCVCVCVEDVLRTAPQDGHKT